MKKLGPALVLALLMAPLAWAYDTKVEVTGRELPKDLVGVGVEEHLGRALNLGLEFQDEDGKIVPLSTYFESGKPVLMAMVYYTCPGLCNYHLNGITAALKKLKWTSGKKFQVVAVSMNTAETPDLAGKKKQTYLHEYGRPEGNAGWHFLVGNKANVQELADELGFHFKWLPDKKQFAHVSVAYVLTPEGKIARYLHGISIDPGTLKFSMLEASNGRIGNVIEQALMYCFQFDPVKNKYTLYAWNIMRIGAALTVFLMALIFIPVWWRELRMR